MKILTLSGGGIRGILSARILVELEKRLGGKIVDHFDFIAGTSTGAILASLLLTGTYTAQECVDMYVQNASIIFKKNYLSIFGLFGSKYSKLGIESCLDKYFGEMMVQDLKKDCLIPCYDTLNRRMRFFTKSDQDGILVKDACRASSAAPTYFPPHINYVDGGVVCNDPAMCAISEVGGYNDSLLLLSIGTGCKMKPYNLNNEGEIILIEPIIDILMSGSEEVCDYHLRKMFCNNGNYIYLQPDLNHVSEAMDCVTPKNIQSLLNKPLVFDYDVVVNKIKKAIPKNG